MSSKAESERLVMYERANAFLKGKLKTLSEDPELEEAFISIEGILNNDYYVLWDDIEDVEVVTDVVTMDYYLDENGGKKVSATEYGDVYAELYSAVSAQLDPAGDEEIIMIDIVISDINEEENTIDLTANTHKATLTQGQVWMTPGGAVYGADQAEACDGTPNPSGEYDAADLIRSYANHSADWRSRCPNGVYLAPRGAYYTYDETRNFNHFRVDPQSGANTWNEVIDNYWKSNTNDCLGYSNEEWYGLYSKMDNLIDYGLERIYNLGVDDEFYMTNYHSHNQNNQFDISPDITEIYYHGRWFDYGILTCR